MPRSELLSQQRLVALGKVQRAHQLTHIMIIQPCRQWLVTQ